MEWIAHNLQILATLGSATVVYLMLRKAAKKDTEEMKVTLDKIDKDVQDMNMRLTRLEGSFEERRYWLSKMQEI